MTCDVPTTMETPFGYLNEKRELHEHWSLPASSTHPHRAALLLTHPTIYKESRPLYFKKTRFFLYDNEPYHDVRPFFNQLKDCINVCIRVMVTGLLSLDARELCSVRRLLRHLFDNIPNVERLRLCIDVSSCGTIPVRQDWDVQRHAAYICSAILDFEEMRRLASKERIWGMTHGEPTIRRLQRELESIEQTGRSTNSPCWLEFDAMSRHERKRGNESWTRWSEYAGREVPESVFWQEDYKHEWVARGWEDAEIVDLEDEEVVDEVWLPSDGQVLQVTTPRSRGEALDYWFVETAITKARSRPRNAVFKARRRSTTPHL